MKKQRIIGVILFIIGITADFLFNLVAAEIQVQIWYNQNRTWILLIGAIFILGGIFLTFVNISKVKTKISLEDNKGSNDISFLDKDENFLREQLTQHQENRRKLLKQKIIYAAGEEPLHLLNQIAAEQKKIQEIEQQLQNLGA